MNKHTPGPWEWDGKVWEYDVENESPWLMQAPVTAIGSKRILSGSIKCDSESNARLIAAAPDLLEGLTQLMRNFPTDYDMAAAGWDRTDIDKACAAHDFARAVFAKATGEAQ